MALAFISAEKGGERRKEGKEGRRGEDARDVAKGGYAMQCMPLRMRSQLLNSTRCTNAGKLQRPSYNLLVA